jgi:sigma-B regulation protein RsbU (phosphoserine phosphatase)
MGEITRLERRIKRVETILILLAIAAIVSGDYMAGPRMSLGYLYLIPLSYSALTHRWRVTLVLVALCVVLRQWLGPTELASWALIIRDWVLTAIFLGVVTTLHRLGTARSVFFDKAREQRDELVREVKMAASVQQHLLNQHEPPSGRLDVAARTEPLKAVGGDYYDFIPLEDERFGVVVADVAGKGLPAAMIMPAVQIAMRTLTMYHTRMADVLKELNHVLFDALEPASYVTLCYAVFDVKNGKMACSNAGHQPVLHMRSGNGDVTWLNRGGTPVGLLPGRDYEVEEIDLQPGDVIVFYTDGIAEAEDRQGEEFGPDRLAEVVKKNRNGSAAELVSIVHDAAARFRDPDPPKDDVTVIVVRIPKNESQRNRGIE